MIYFRKTTAALIVASLATFNSASAARADAGADELLQLFKEVCLAAPLQVEKSIAKVRSLGGFKLKGLSTPQEGDALVQFNAPRRTSGGTFGKFKEFELCAVYVKPKISQKATMAAALQKVRAFRGISSPLPGSTTKSYYFKYKKMLLVVQTRKRQVHLSIASQ